MVQRGWITQQQRRKTGPVWVYHWYITKSDSGRKAEHTCVLGAVASFPREKDAWQEIARRHLQPQSLNNTGPQAGRLTFRELAITYKENGVKRLAENTQANMHHIVDHYLLPRWGRRYALEIQPLEIEQWLGSLPLANPTKDRIRRVMSIIFSDAQKYGIVPRTDSSNPLRWVRQSVKSDYRAVIVEPSIAARILESLSGTERALTLLVAATGLRISEALGLRWEDIDYDNRRINLRRAWVGEAVRQNLKTEGSQRPVPLCDALAECLLAWHAATPYGQPSDWVFASNRSKGQRPRSAGVLAADYLRPAAIAAGVKLQPGQRFGFHNLRHSLATFLINKGTDIKTVQGLLRHANVTTTLSRYAQSVNASMLEAQEKVLLAMNRQTETIN
jgi:integrase